MRRLLDDHVAILGRPLVTWYYTPMMLPFSRHLDASVVVYDCMDELSKFRFAPERLLDLEQELIDRADLVFTGGTSLYEAKKSRHGNVHCFPSSVDRKHFATARRELPQPDDQAELKHPRLGFYGVIDERFDIDLLRQIAELRPDWSFVMVGPVVKISEDELPRAANIHYLGGKTYEQLPAYLSGWDVALMPFAMNESTQFISPTKTPEYLAGGKPVVSTPVKDVVRSYGHLQGVHIAHRRGWLRTLLRHGARTGARPAATGSPRPISCCPQRAGTRPRRAWPVSITEVLGERAGEGAPALLVAAE